MWNIISKEFVSVAAQQNAEFHVFLRVYDLNSVLIRQEVEQIRTLGLGNNIFWHPIVSEEADYLELDQNCNLSENHQPCNETECLRRLLTYHAQVNPLGRENMTMANSVADQYGMTEDEVMEHIALLQGYPNLQ